MGETIMVVLHIYGALAIILLFCDHPDTGYKSSKMKIGVAEPILTQKREKKPLGQRYQYSTRWGNNIMVVLPVCGDLAIFLLFFNHQDTESESWEIEIGVSGPILTQKKSNNVSMGQKHPYYTRWVKNVVIIHLYGDIATFYYFVTTKTLNLNHEK